jgi:hypothetical protein
LRSTRLTVISDTPAASRQRPIAGRIHRHRKPDAIFVQERLKRHRRHGGVMLENRVQADNRNVTGVESRSDAHGLGQAMAHATGAQDLERGLHLNRNPN